MAIARVEGVIRSRTQFLRNATGPDPESARRIQEEVDNNSALAKLEVMCLADRSTPPDALVIRDNSVAIIHFPQEAPQLFQTTDGDGKILHSFQEERLNGQCLVDIIKIVKSQVTEENLPTRMGESVVVFDRTTPDNPLGINGNGIIRRRWGQIKTLDIDGTPYRAFIVKKRISENGTINWA